VLEAAGVQLDITPGHVSRCLEEVGIGFMFAPAHHGAMKHAIGPRREMGVRTIFNVLGPLTNPAGAPNQVLGVFSRELVKPMAKVLKKLDSSHVMVVHAKDGLDEISINRKTWVAELKNGQIREYKIRPGDFGMKRASLDTIRADSVEDSLRIINEVLDNRPGPARDIVCLNAGAAIYTAGVALSLDQGVALAADAIASGKAREKLRQLVELTRSFKQPE
jgi:anthranilate phosphoribosyltransferase